MSGRTQLAFVALAFVGVLACQELLGYESFHAAELRSAACESAVEPGRHGPKMALLQSQDGSCSWIDTTEVTVRQYSEFLAQPPPAQDGACAWNGQDEHGASGFVPSEECSRDVPGGVALDGQDNLDRPMTCVDHCDAEAFCAWAGKGLCSDAAQVSAPAGHLTWLNACSGEDVQRLYGCEGACSSACNGRSGGEGTLRSVASSADCAVLDADTPVFDLSGNAAEWTRACESDGLDAACLHRGGSYDGSDSALECSSFVRAPRRTALPTLGFRCCAEADAAVAWRSATTPFGAVQ